MNKDLERFFTFLEFCVKFKQQETSTRDLLLTWLVFQMNSEQREMVDDQLESTILFCKDKYVDTYQLALEMKRLFSYAEHEADAILQQREDSL